MKNYISHPFLIQLSGLNLNFPGYAQNFWVPSPKNSYGWGGGRIPSKSCAVSAPPPRQITTIMCTSLFPCISKAVHTDRFYHRLYTLSLAGCHLWTCSTFHASAKILQKYFMSFLYCMKISAHSYAIAREISLAYFRIFSYLPP